MRRHQPYHYSAKTRLRHPLSLLVSINNGDKHRTIQPLWTFPTKVDTEITDTRDCDLRLPEHVRRSAKVLEVGTEIAFVRARKTGPNPELEMQLTVAAEPAMEQQVSVRDWHALCGILIFKMLREFSDQPPGIDEIGAILVPLTS